ncbi:MAG TPA: cation diffusion facilitator family transporter [Burkholderiales bacterium]|nr:cation diffusion facilitator family transporter [Burkholderiales bacterium]
MAAPDLRFRTYSHHGETPSRVHWALLITLSFAGVEAIGGWWSGSLALLSDAGHMFSDCVALGLTAFAGWVTKHPPTRRHTYGLLRAEVIAALLNGLMMLLIILFIVVEAVARLREPQPVSGAAVMVIAGAGLAANILVIFLLSHGEQTLNARAALLHVMGDLLGSVAALLAGAVIYFTGWLPIDPILSLVVAGLILFSTLNLLREALHVLMEGVPLNLQIEAVGREMTHIEGIRSVHDLHIWTLASGKVALSAHLEVPVLAAWPKVLEAAQVMLHRQFGIDHVTLQPEEPQTPEKRYPGSIRIYPKK